MNKVAIAFLTTTLSAHPDARQGVGLCAVELDAARTGEIQLLPDGLFTARDGRPADLAGWVMNAANAERIIAAARARQTPFVIDYEHQTIRADDNGQPAPAAGWFNGSDMVYRPGQGLFASVTWTERAQQMIAAGEYKFISPVLHYDKTTGDVLGIFNAALTNSPAIDGMNDVLARAAAMYGFSDDEETHVNWKEKLIDLLGLDKDVEDDEIEKALQARIGEANEAAEAKQKLATAETEVAQLKEAVSGAKPDPTKYVGVEVVEELRGQIADLSTKTADREVEDVIQGALTDARGPLLLDAQIEWARELGKKDLAALKAYLETATPIAALRGRQTSGYTPPAGGQPMATEQVAILSNMGLSSKEIESMQKEAQ